MKGFIITLTIALYALQAHAQSSIKGKVLEPDGKPAVYVTVALYAIADSVLLGGTTSNTEGAFQLDKIIPGKYFITLSMIGFEKVFREVNITDAQTYTIPDITLREGSQEIKEVTVSATRNFVEQQADKMVINPEASITSASDDALEVLRKSPGVIIDKDDNVTIKGKSVRVMIDGRPSYMSGEQLAAMLRTMQAASIDRIEIIENPPAKYDAEGDGGIINIRTKRSVMRGYNGSMTLGAGMGKRFSDNYGVDLNFRTEKWNVYGSYYGGQRRGFADADLTRRFSQSDGSVYKQNSDFEWNSYYNNARLGVDYYITPKQVVGVMARGNFSKNPESESEGEASIIDAAGNELQHLNTNNVVEGAYDNMMVNLNYKWSLDDKGHELSIDADMARYLSENASDMNTRYIPPTTPLIISNNQENTSDFYSVKADYVRPLGDKAKMETGVKSSRAKIDSDLDYRQQGENGNWSDPQGMSNRFIYREDIYAAYISGRYSFSEKTNIQLGLRGEQTVSEGDNVTIDQQEKQDYFNLFPSLFVQQKLNDNHQLVFSYSYRIGRPPYWMLNPFIWMLDPNTYTKGNPYLDPQFSHTTKLSYTLKNKYIFFIDYGYTKDAWVQVFEQDDATRTAIITRENLNNYHDVTLSAVLPVKITKWWSTNTNLAAFYLQYISPLGEGEIDKSQISYRVNTTFTFALPKDFTFELTGWYTGKRVYGMMDMDPVGSVDAGVQKRLFKNKATLKLGVSDIFKTTGWFYSSQYANVDLRGKEYYDSRRVTLTFNWRFGRTDIKAARQRSTGLDEETGRAGSGR